LSLSTGCEYRGGLSNSNASLVKSLCSPTLTARRSAAFATVVTPQQIAIQTAIDTAHALLTDIIRNIRLSKKSFCTFF
jgi:hypothetical protein